MIARKLAIVGREDKGEALAGLEDVVDRFLKRAGVHPGRAACDERRHDAIEELNDRVASRLENKRVETRAQARLEGMLPRELDRPDRDLVVVFEGLGEIAAGTAELAFADNAVTAKVELMKVGQDQLLGKLRHLVSTTGDQVFFRILQKSSGRI
jgi:hypothetical protein